MKKHKYRLGQWVLFQPGRQTRVGEYKIVHLLPQQGIEYLYRIKSVSEPYERVASEVDLSLRTEDRGAAKVAPKAR